MSLRRAEAEKGAERLPISFFVITGVAAAASLAVFFLRIGEVGAFVSLADALLIFSIIPLSIASLLFVWGRGGFDIFIFAFSRIFRRGGGEDYYDFLKRGRGEQRLQRPLLALGAVVFLCAAILSAISLLLSL